MLFYFIGTGNSLFVARQIEEHPISIPQVIHWENLEFSAERIGVAAPIYGHEVPPMVKEFLKRGTFHHACPQKAIGLTIPEKNPQARYRNEHVSLQDIIQANHQG